MKRFRLLAWWLFHGRERVDLAWDRIEALERLTAEQNQIMVALASELNVLRNNLPAILTQPMPATPPGVRRAGSWRAFAAAAEGRPEPIQIERKL